MKSTHQSNSFRTHTYYVAGLVLTIAASGCSEAGRSGGLRAAGYISSGPASGSSDDDSARSSRPLPLNAAYAGAGAEEPPIELEGGAGDGAGEEMPEDPAAYEAQLSDDSVRCGNGVVDMDELCDFAIPEGEPGACPTQCEPLDACHEAMLLVRSCWTRCVLGPERPCE